MCIEGVISGKSDENKKVWGYATRMPAKMEHACARMSQKMYAQGLFLGKVMLYHANAIPCHPMQSHDSLCQPISIFVSSLKIKGALFKTVLNVRKVELDKEDGHGNDWKTEGDNVVTDKRGGELSKGRNSS
jgi:hypothetical protein